MSIHTHLAYLRQHHKFSLRQLSEKTGGLSIGYLSDLERGRTSPSLETITRLAAAYGMSVPVFLGGADLDLAPDEMKLLNAYRAGDTLTVLQLILDRAKRDE